MLKVLLPYYERELSHLRRLSREFAEQYPKIAGRLAIEGDTCADPHVERLLEGFAFLAARVHHKLDDEFPEITDAFLEIMYPHYLRPIPSMSIAQFHINLKEPQLTSRYTVPRHTQLHSQTINGISCNFRSCYPVDLWPIHITAARVEPIERSGFSAASDVVAVIRIQLDCVGATNFTKLGINTLRFFLNGEASVVHTLYELLFNNCCNITLSSSNGKKVVLAPDSLVPVGFTEDEGMLDYDHRSFLGYRLLTDYFSFPDKFLFFDLQNLEVAAKSGFIKQMEIVISISAFERAERLDSLITSVTAKNFLLGCAPVVNLFKQNAEPIRWTHLKTEHQVIPDLHRVRGIEAYSIDSVRMVSRSRTEEVKEFKPFFSHKHGVDVGSKNYWYASRKASTLKEEEGTDLYLSLVDLNFNPSVPTVDSVSLELTCTNRDLPTLLPFGGSQADLNIEGSSVVKRINFLRKPTQTIRPPLRHGARWRLISHLTLNHLSIVEDGREALLEMLSLYNFSETGAIKKQINGITDVVSRPTVVRLKSLQRMTFVQGTEVTIEFDESEYTGSGIFLFASVLERFLALYCSVNSFTQLVVKTRQRERGLTKWPARSGTAILV